MAGRFLGIRWHQVLEFDLGLLVIEMSGAGPRKNRGALGIQPAPAVI